MPKTIVVNNLEALVIGQLPHSQTKNGDPLQIGETVTFVPGINVVDSDKLETLRKNLMFDLHFKTEIKGSAAPEHNREKLGKKILEVMKVGKDGKISEGYLLEKLDYETCKSIISETFTSDLLTAWQTMEGRSEVRALLANQSQKLATGQDVTAATAGR